LSGKLQSYIYVVASAKLLPQKAKVLWLSANYLKPYNLRDGIKPLKIDPLPIGSINGIKPAVT